MRDWRKEVERRLRGARLDGATEHEIVDELAQHLEDSYQELLAQGLAPNEAARQALSELEDEDTFAEQLSRTVGARPEAPALGRTSREGISGLWSDLRFGARMLIRSPLYTTVSVLVIGIGIGANTATFTALDFLLLRPPSGVEDARELAVVYTSDYSGPIYGRSSYPDYESIAAEPDLFESVAVHRAQTFGLEAEGWDVAVAGEMVSANYFDVLGVSPAAGRFFGPDESVTSRVSPVAVIGHALWQASFGGSSEAIGSTVRINGESVTLIGIAPRDFVGLGREVRTQLWLPVSAPGSITGLDLSQRSGRGFEIIGRMRDGETTEALQPRLKVLASRLHDAFPDNFSDVNDRARVLTVLSESEARVFGSGVGEMSLLSAAVLMVLLIACTNVANMTLSRASARRSEMGIRIALGASRARIVRHVLAESIVLAAMGGTLGVLLAFILTEWLSATGNVDVSVNLRVLAVASLVTLLTGIFFGLAPALQSSRAPAPSLKEDARGGARSRVRSALVVVQIASSLVLLVGGSLFIRSLQAAQSIDTGFDADDVVVMRFNLGLEGYSGQRTAAFYEEILERARILPGVSAVALAVRVPLAGAARKSIHVEGREEQPGEDMEFPYNGVTPGYFATMGLEVRAGRAFTPEDRDGAPPVAMVSEAFARRFWPGENPLGKRVSFVGTGGPWADVIGIVADAKDRSLTEEPQPFFYYPHAQRPDDGMALLVRSTADPGIVMNALRSAEQSIDPDLRPGQLITFREQVASTTNDLLLAAGLLTGLGLFAILLAVIGLYGLVAFSVTQRSREFGLRMALGAAASDVRGLVMGQALRLVLYGVLFGVPVAAVAALLARSILIVSPLDPVAFLTVPALLSTCAVFASYAPARRAMRQDPAQTLRAE